MNLKKNDRIIYYKPDYWNPKSKTRFSAIFLEYRGKKSALIEYFTIKKTVRLDSISAVAPCQCPSHSIIPNKDSKTDSDDFICELCGETYPF